MANGWVYIAFNESFPDLVKVGSSERDPEIRIKELNSTGLPTPFKLVYWAFVENGPSV